LIDERCLNGKIKIDNVCVCPQGKIEEAEGNCNCPNGYTEDWRKNCIKAWKCAELSKLLQSYLGTTNPYLDADTKSVRIALTNIDDDLDNTSESGFGLFNLGEYETWGPTAQNVPTSANRMVRFPPRNYQFGTIHTHPNGSLTDGEQTVPMFSLEDIYTLWTLADSYGTGSESLQNENSAGNDLFVCILVVKLKPML
tara:strand:+ start:6135 stop:6725 length:591 start_codon:yes stop_codon:yes gene_type:complete